MRKRNKLPAKQVYSAFYRRNQPVSRRISPPGKRNFQRIPLPQAFDCCLGSASMKGRQRIVIAIRS
jgi:hypothetical protein